VSNDNYDRNTDAILICECTEKADNAWFSGFWVGRGVTSSRSKT